MKKTIKLFMPPIITQAFHRPKALKNKTEDSHIDRPKTVVSLDLFDNEPNFFEEEIKKCSVYGEYGTGSSTSFALNHSDVLVNCVDTDPYWLKQATKGFNDTPRLQAKAVDLGTVLAWGIPVGAARIDQFIEYTDWIWKHEKLPNLVLIDGRLRVCCFLTTLKNCNPGCRIIFDDYVHRPQYHFVERFLAVSETRGRQAFFVVPEEKGWTNKDLDLAIDAFRCNLN